MIVTLGGHVDHGKTSLVRALTGTNTDRLAEEQARGLTIDLGFAYGDFGGQRIGFVDVPGHHRFIHNMVAGVARNQFCLLVVAADDGPMPQTVEHLHILSLTGVERGVIAITKADRVSDAQIEEVRSRIADVVRGSFLAESEVVVTSVETGTGIKRLTDLLAEAARDHELDTDPTQGFRLAVDRSFLVRGAGVVVTGTVHSGRLAVGSVCEVYPHSRSVRVRSLRAQDADAEVVTTGDRAAANLVGLSAGDVVRGDWLALPGMRPAHTVTVRLTVLSDFPRPLKHWSPVHAYHATSHTTARVAVLESSRYAPGESGLVDLVCESPLLAKRGDTLVVRDQSLDRTLGGGYVVSLGGPAGRRRAPARLAALAAHDLASAETALRALTAIEPVAIDEFANIWNLSPNRILELASDARGVIVDGVAVADDRWTAWQETALETLTVTHEREPDRAGLRANELGVPMADAVAAELLRRKAIEMHDGFARLPDHRQKLSPDLEQMLQTVAPLLGDRQPPSLGDLSKRLGIPLGPLGKSLVQLAHQKCLTRISDNRFYLPEQLRALQELAVSLGAAGPFDVRQFRDAAEIGRNVAIEILEHLDAAGVTRRQGNQRVLLNPDKPSW